MVRLFVAVAIIALAAVVAAYKLPTEAEIKAEFVKFVHKHEKTTYGAQEIEKRFQIFKDNFVRIQLYNRLYNTDIMEVNKFADLTPQEFRAAYLMPKKTVAQMKGEFVGTEPATAYNTKDAPTSIDWRTLGAVTPVKNQGSCGSCWAFSTTGNVEGQWFLANKTNGSPILGLSEQNLVDCDHQCTMYENQQSCDAGCNGGLQPNAYSYIIKNGGIDTESSYPYEGYDDTCRYNAANRGAQIRNWTFISTNEQQMATYCAEHGPLAIAADAEEWQFYIWGVFEGPCGTSLDHGILIVGYGTETDELGFSIDYWIVKNSWGADWGLDGYLWIIRGVGECGLNTYVTSSIV